MLTLRNHGYADTREEACAAFRAAWEAASGSENELFVTRPVTPPSSCPLGGDLSL